MTYSVTRTELLSSVRARTNTENQLDFCDDVEVTGYINAGITSIWDLILNSTWGGDRYQRSHTFSTEAGRSNYERPSDYYRTLSADAFVENDRPVSIYPFPKEWRNILRGSAPLLAYPWSPGAQIYYRWEGGDMVFLPVPQSVFQIRLNYAPVAPRLYAADDSFDGVNGWEEYVILYAAIRVLTKCGPYETIPLLTQQMADEKARIMVSAPQADMQQAERTHILERFDDYDATGGMTPWDGF